MKIAVTGASGLMGTALVPSLRADGHEVVRLVRRTAAAPDEVSWDPEAGTVDLRPLEGTDAVVHLAGAGVGDHRWTDAYKQEILDSRRLGTGTIARAVAALDPAPSVLVSASAMGYYGDTGDVAGRRDRAEGHRLRRRRRRGVGAGGRSSPRGRSPCRAPTDRARRCGQGRRLGPDAARSSGLGVGGRLGSGHQWWSFISLTDQVAALKMLIDSDLSGPVNLTTPHPATNAEVTQAMGEALHRPTLLPVPVVRPQGGARGVLLRGAGQRTGPSRSADQGRVPVLPPDDRLGDPLDPLTVADAGRGTQERR